MKDGNVQVCPLRMLGLKEKDNIKVIVDYQCLKEGCAWWVKRKPMTFFKDSCPAHCALINLK